MAPETAANRDDGVAAEQCCGVTSFAKNIACPWFKRANVAGYLQQTHKTRIRLPAAYVQGAFSPWVIEHANESISRHTGSGWRGHD
jgi:hypothetical protein